MMRMWRPDLVLLHYLNQKDKLTRKSVMDIDIEKERTKSDEIVLIILITIFLLLFCATSLKVFIALLVSGLVVGIFGLIKEKKWIKW